MSINNDGINLTLLKVLLFAYFLLKLKEILQIDVNDRILGITFFSRPNRSVVIDVSFLHNFNEHLKRIGRRYF